jgi:hypothetical protein
MTKRIAWVKQAKKIAEQMNRDGVRCVTSVPRKALPEGRVLVHNRVAPYPKIGERISRMDAVQDRQASSVRL